jgi:hypothetical protein
MACSNRQDLLCHWIDRLWRSALYLCRFHPGDGAGVACVDSGASFLGVRGGAALIAAGSPIIFGIRARTVAALTGAAILVVVMIDDIPGQLGGSPGHLGVWTNTFKAFTTCGGA